MEDDARKVREKRLAIFIIANSIVWGCVLVAMAFILKGTGYTQKLIPIMGVGAGLSSVILPGGLLAIRKKSD